MHEVLLLNLLTIFLQTISIGLLRLKLMTLQGRWNAYRNCWEPDGSSVMRYQQRYTKNKKNTKQTIKKNKYRKKKPKFIWFSNCLRSRKKRKRYISLYEKIEIQAYTLCLLRIEIKNLIINSTFFVPTRTPKKYRFFFFVKMR